MDFEEFNDLNDDGKEKSIVKDYSNIKYYKGFDRKLYDTALSSYFDSKDFQTLSEEQKKEIMNFFNEFKKSMDAPKFPGKFKLPEKFYLEVMGDALSEFHSMNTISEFPIIMKHYKGELDYVRNQDNKFDEKIGTLLWDLYQRPDLQLGIHGAKLEDDFDISQENCDYFKHGIMVHERYTNGDARRTVNFQDLPGKEWSLGRVSFLKLLSYEYSSKNNSINKDESTANYSCIVVRPTNIQNTQYDSECPQEFSLVTPYTNIKTNDGNVLRGHLVKPEFILGVFKNNDQFVFNPKCDLDKLSELNERIGERNKAIALEQEEAARAKVEKLGEETSDIKVAGKKNILDLFKKILEKVKNKNRGKEEPGNDSK